MVIFGMGNVIDASMCFGNDAKRVTQNCVWEVRHQIISENQVKPATLRDLDRGERLLKIVSQRAGPAKPRQLPKWMLVPVPPTFYPNKTLQPQNLWTITWGSSDLTSWSIPDDDGPRAA